MDLSNFKIKKPKRKIHNKNQYVANNVADYLDDKKNIKLYCILAGKKGASILESALGGVKESVSSGLCYNKKRLFMYLIKDKKNET